MPAASTKVTGKLAIVTGYKELDAKLRKMPEALQRKLVKGALKKSTDRDKQETIRIVKAEAYDTGAYSKSLKVRQIKRSRVKVGSMVIVDTQKLFQEYAKKHGRFPGSEKGQIRPAFYPAMIEYGSPTNQPISPMRRALYDNAKVYQAYFVGDLRQFIATQKVDTKLPKAQ